VRETGLILPVHERGETGPNGPSGMRFRVSEKPARHRGWANSEDQPECDGGVWCGKNQASTSRGARTKNEDEERLIWVSSYHFVG